MCIQCYRRQLFQSMDGMFKGSYITTFNSLLWQREKLPFYIFGVSVPYTVTDKNCSTLVITFQAFSMSSCSTEVLVLTGLIAIQSHMTTGCCNLLNLTKIDQYKMFILSLSYRPLYIVLLLRVKYGIVNSSAALLLLKWLPPEWMKRR